MGYVQLGYSPKKHDLVCEFRIDPAKGYTMQKAAESVASESSVGTWTDVVTMKPGIMKIAAKVFEIKGHCVRIAYPSDLFEPGNMPQILSSIAGNIFGMKALDNIRLESIQWPRQLMRSFMGPMFGVPGVRKLLKIRKRPITGTIVKPKVGLNETEHAKSAYEAWSGGIDIVKDDENLSDMRFNRFEKRVAETLKLRDRAEKETGERKMYMPNVTAETGDMLRRARFVKDHGGEYAMVDIISTGWSGLQTLREENEDLKLVLHAHRAGHASFTRNRKHGISMLVVAEAARLVGVDQIHVGTAVGKMEGSREEVMEIGEEIEHRIIRGHGHVLSENWGDIKPVFAVCSGGLHPGLIPKLVSILGKDIIIQAGGGIWGHPRGGAAGAKAMRQAVDACMEGIDLKEYAKNNYELRLALDKWKG